MSDHFASSDAPEPTTPVAPPRLHITASDLQSHDVESRVQEMRSAAAPQLVRQVGEQPSQGLGVFGIILAMALAGLIGGLLGWAVSEVASQQWVSEQVLSDPDAEVDFECVFALPADSDPEAMLNCLDYKPWYGWNRTVGNIVFLGAFGLTLGAVIAGWDAISARSLAKFRSRLLRSSLYLVGAVIIGAWIAQAVFESMTEDVLEASDMHLPRGVAWAIFGSLLGLAIGASTRVTQRAAQGAAGGLVGGFIGGFVFDFIQLGDQSNAILNRMVGLTITGVAIAVSISLIEVATRQHWLEIVSGGMAGKQFILYHDRTTVGSSPTCDVTLIKDPSMAPQHLQLVRHGQSLEAGPVDPGFVVTVNGTPIVKQQLNDSDLIQIGSTVLRYRSKQQQMPTGMPLPQHGQPAPPGTTIPTAPSPGYQPSPPIPGRPGGPTSPGAPPPGPPRGPQRPPM